MDYFSDIYTNKFERLREMDCYYRMKCIIEYTEKDVKE
jgi:hypothetical protein